jgi:hypothetical protein
MNTFARAAFAFFAIVFTAVIVWASFRGDFGAEFAAITTMPWGKVTLADLYIGFLLYGAAVWFIEDKLITKLFWVLPIVVLGNAWSLVWVAARWDKVITRLRVK